MDRLSSLTTQKVVPKRMRQMNMARLANGPIATTTTCVGTDTASAMNLQDNCNKSNLKLYTDALTIYRYIHSSVYIKRILES